MKVTIRSSVIHLFRIVISLLAVSLFFSLNCFAAGTSADKKETEWILAARKFELPKNSTYGKTAEAAASVIPKLILERISVDMTRAVLRDEQAARKTNSLLNERLSLFLELSKEVKKRDALILNSYSTLEYEIALNNQQKKIDEVQKKIDDNLEKQNAVFYPDNGRRRIVRQIQKELRSESEKIKLYQNDPEKLFAASKEAEEEGVFSWKYSKEIISAKINSLITGNFIIYGNYISVSVDLIGFPGAKRNASATEVGAVSDLDQIAENLAFELLPKIANGLPVEMEFRLLPEDARKTAVLTIDNVVYDGIPDKAIVSSGFHSVSIEADNYARETFVYDFSGKDKFLIEVKFRESREGSVKLVLSKFVAGNMFFDGKFVGSSSPSSWVEVPLKVNGDSVFGFFEGSVKDKEAEGGFRKEYMFMQLPTKLMADGAELETRVKVEDLGKKIDHRRRMMYVSYSALIMSLPVMFYAYGKFNYYQRGLSSSYGNVSADDYNKYKNLSLWTTGASIACGVWFAVELFAYLSTTDRILPPKARKVRKSTLRKIEAAKRTDEIGALMRAETEVLSPLMPKENESENPVMGPEQKAKIQIISEE